MQNIITTAKHTTPIPLLLLLAAQGFGAPKQRRRNPEREFRKLRSKSVQCPSCKGMGKKPCPICKGSKLMSGFLGATVECVPCDGKGNLGRKCEKCDGLGFFPGR